MKRGDKVTVKGQRGTVVLVNEEKGKVLVRFYGVAKYVDAAEVEVANG